MCRFDSFHRYGGPTGPYLNDRVGRLEQFILFRERIDRLEQGRVAKGEVPTDELAGQVADELMPAECAETIRTDAQNGRVAALDGPTRYA
ncbi:hypothetical protein [Natrinema halophilum]|uniref:Uncharacterized protein n=1 Tax=Natrinema halophilum TaxID=1699371 RepID=A0A7D5KCP1_9EURY|nr:hypothetical protein [Natrinema halophilum]QLG48716.1 hypothetical protein HYG82_07575 [Natrinema halophilum]